MFNASTSGIVASAVPIVPPYVRAHGGVRVRFGVVQGETRALERAESGGFRVRCPRRPPCCEAVLINTGGGMAGGDHMQIAIVADRGAAAVVTTQAAEKVYRSQGAATEIDTVLKLDAASRLDWLPQETILFGGSRWRRRTSVDMSGDATLLLVESSVFGRVASDETMGWGLYHDRWRIRRDDRLIVADDARLDGDIGALLAAKASGHGTRALATMLYVAPDAENRLDEARRLLADAVCEWGASAWNGMLLIRLMSPQPHRLRADIVGLLQEFRHIPLPRSWQC